MLPEIITTEIFWGAILGITSLLLTVVIPAIDLYRRPEVYSEEYLNNIKEMNNPHKK
ncbi:MAG: hypothetical protein Q7S77_01560 [Candidatus Staskawiczbacteria bacterium]|nr:hypothetical protein [Candidatus Staskawiczbacteria bacterium]